MESTRQTPPPPRSGLAHIRALIQANPIIRRQLDQRDRDNALYGQVLDQLPEPVRSHCCDASLSDGLLTLHLDSAVWTTRARFLTDGLLRALDRDDITRVAYRIRVVPGSPSDRGAVGLTPKGAKDERPVCRQLSARVVQHLLATADMFQASDREFAAIFRRFAKRHARATQISTGDRE
ncbi:MAG: DUF721 domain-containing protein [Sphingobacteriia bacterium]|nr:DUF721 domain-containing protein [Sphingobacteriia bacterium]NCC39543.1 DUF721 domain-containing protein [Gammaproteobacteria bacterium]